MRIIVADVLGMCFGVRDALAIIEDIDHPEAVTIHGELVHNAKVLDQLHDRGFHMVDERRRISLPITDTVLITAHGVSQKERRRLHAAGKQLIDTTCPLVTRAHEAAQKLQRDGYHVLVIGKPGHVEIRGIVEDLESYDVLQDVVDVRTYPQRKLGIMCQTTAPLAHAHQIRQTVERMNPHAEVRFLDTVCHPTKDHQKALERLIDQVQAVVVVGGRNSNNTQQLVRRCKERGVPAFHVQDADDLQPEWFDGVDVAGLTAGTSTLDGTIREVQEGMLSYACGLTGN